MRTVELSAHFKSRQPSAIRMAQIEFSKRSDNVEAINTAIGNVSLAMHPSMIRRMENLSNQNSPFKDGVVKYTATMGREETNRAFLNIIASSGFRTQGLYSQITDGGSQAMELAILGGCGPAGSYERPLVLIDPAYTNYKAMANRLGRKTVSVTRRLKENGRFTLPDMTEIETVLEKHRPGALVVIPYDNPTGQYLGFTALKTLAALCVKHNMWIISDEAYRELYYTAGKPLSIWSLTETDVPGITGRRISIETASKVWNACGLRIGALITDNKDFHQQSVAEYTANLCSNALGQYIFGALAHESHKDLRSWYQKQRGYYKPIMETFTNELRELLPGIIISNPDASIYSVLDVRNISTPDFDALDFVMHCAKKGDVAMGGKHYTLLTAPLAGFYSGFSSEENPGRTQMRVAYVETTEEMKLVPRLFTALFKEFNG